MRTLTLDASVNNAHHGGGDAVDGGWRLGMPHLLEGKSHNVCLHCVEEEHAQFGFGGGCGDALEDGGEGEDCAIEANRASVLGDGAKEKCPPARLRAPAAVRYDAALCTLRTMSLL